MAMYYAVEFPSEDAKSKGPYVVPENKVKVEKGQTQVLWTVVNENGDLMEEYFEATNLKKGSKRDCGEFIDRLKESREKADISNKEGRCRKKPSKLNDYENPENLNSASNAPPLKKPRKTLIDEAWNDFRTNSVDELDEDDIEELDGNEVLVRWEEKVAKKRTNGFSRQKKNKERSQSRSGSKPKKANKPLRAAESKVKNAVKKARDETVFSQSSEIGKSLALEMRVVRHGLNRSESVEFKISFSRHSTFGMLRKQLSQMTGILPADQLIIIKGEEWVMEDREVITEVWSPEDLVAVSDKGTKLDGLSDVENNKETNCERETPFNQEKIGDIQEGSDDYIKEMDMVDDKVLNWTQAAEETSEKWITTHQDKAEAQNNKMAPASKSAGIELEERVKNLQCQMSLMADDIKNMAALLRNFASCKACIKKLYKATPEPEKLSPVLTPFVQAAPDTAGKRLFTPPAPTVTPDERSRKLPDHAKDTSTTPTPLKHWNASHENSNGSPASVVLIGSPSRGVYVKKEKLELIKTNLPKRFALKLFELVFGREEAKDGSVEGKGEKLSRLDPNRLAAVHEETERRFAEDKSYVWPEIKKAIDEKCRMVRNNRCFVWAGVNVNGKTE